MVRKILVLLYPKAYNGTMSCLYFGVQKKIVNPNTNDPAFGYQMIIIDYTNTSVNNSLRVCSVWCVWAGGKNHELIFLTQLVDLLIISLNQNIIYCQWLPAEAIFPQSRSSEFANITVELGTRKEPYVHIVSICKL